MKASHLVTPRTLGDCQFIASHDPIDRGPPAPLSLRLYVWTVALAAITVLLWRLP